MLLNKGTTHRGSPSLQKIVRYTILTICAIVFVSVSVLLLFPDTGLNGFLKNRVTQGMEKNHPEYALRIAEVHYNVWENCIQCDSITFKNANAAFTCRIYSASIKKINWIKIFLHGDITPRIISNSILDAKGIVLDLPKSHNELRCEMLHLSGPDSSMVTDSVTWYSLIGDEQFFGKSNYRQTRLNFTIPQIRITGLYWMALIQGNGFIARRITLCDFFADILVNMDKPSRRSSSKPLMPNEALHAMNGIVNIDSIKIINGRLNYAERYALHAQPGVITFSKIMLSITKIANHTNYPDTIALNGKGLFMDSGIMTLAMALPLSSKDFSLRYSGSLGTMNLAALNKFLEPAEHRRIKSGIVHHAAYSINVLSGHASGILHAEYQDLSIAVLDKKTGSENGIFNRLSSLIGKLFVIHGSNLPDKGRTMNVGIIKYSRNQDNNFTQFLWFGLRSGVGDIVGF